MNARPEVKRVPDDQAVQLEVLQRANEAKKEKIQDLLREYSALESKYNRAKEELERQQPTKRESGVTPAGYALCCNLSRVISEDDDVVKSACTDILRTIYDRYPETYVGVIIDQNGSHVIHIQQIDATINRKILEWGSIRSDIAELVETLNEVRTMFSAFRAHAPGGKFSVILIGYDQRPPPSLDHLIEFFRGAEITIHNVIIDREKSLQQESFAWSMAKETGGNNIVFSQSLAE
ncbi:hypothetical protein BDV96DRAFT_571305 [Lophiotrema nucula]|uniref:Uncharacterized protein n=1 Tax=Lophiotrema nucula TaxID=690887 RepID=A0A6A5ZF05_9PLEO|nr:hypothetical protein BDV96DRAFT_571305 [Lophiotrema nucula]